VNMIGAVGLPSSPLPHPAPTIHRRERHGGIELIDGVLRILRTIPIHRIEGIVGVELIDRIGGVAGTSLVVREASLAGWRSRESPLVKFMSFRLLRLWHRAAILGPVGTPLKYQIDRQAPPSTIGQYSWVLRAENSEWLRNFVSAHRFFGRSRRIFARTRWAAATTSRPSVSSGSNRSSGYRAATP